MYLTQEFAAFIASLRYDQLPSGVVSQAKERIMDTVGAALAGRSNWEYAEQLEQACVPLGAGSYPVFGSSNRCFPAARAAMINAVYAHAVELDDGHKNAGCHAGAVIVPTALVMGQELGRTGKEILTAVVAGYEVTYRIASHVNPNQINRGFHPSSNCGVYGAMAAAGYLMGLSEAQLANGLGQAGMLASGTMEATRSGQRSKCVQVGNAAYNGIFAAYLAKSGMEGCLSALEGKDGLFHTQSAQVDVDSICQGLGSVYSIGDTYNKMYPCCRHAQPGIEGVLDLAEAHQIQPEDVAEIQIGTHQVAYDLAGQIIKPKNSGEAKFSLAYGAAAALLDHSFGVKHLTEQAYTDPRILQLAQRATCSVDPEVQAEFPQRRGAKVTITLKDGTVYQKTLYDLKGSPGNPVGWAELETKFTANAEVLFSGEVISQLIVMFHSMEELERVDTLMELLSEAAPRRPDSTPGTAVGSSQ